MSKNNEKPENWHPADFHIKEFFQCAESNNTERAQELINLFPQDIINNTDYNGNSALHLAAKNGHLEMVTLLVENGANLHEINEQGLTPLEEAVNNQRTVLGSFLGFKDTKQVQNYLEQAINQEKTKKPTKENLFNALPLEVQEDIIKAQKLKEKLDNEKREIAKAIAKQEEKKELFDVLPSNEAIDLEVAKKRIAQDQEKTREMHQKKEFEQAKREFEADQEKARNEIAKEKEIKEKAIKEKILNIANSENLFVNEKRLQKKIQKISKEIENKSIEEIAKYLNNYKPKKSYSANIAKYFLGRKTDQDLMMKLIDKLKDAVKNPNDPHISQSNELKRYESKKKSQSH